MIRVTNGSCIKILTLGDCLSLPQGFLHLYTNYFQISFSPEHCLANGQSQSKPNDMLSIHGWTVEGTNCFCGICVT